MAPHQSGGRWRADTRPYGPEKAERVMIAITDPDTLPELSTFSLVTTLPAPGSRRAHDSELAAASLQEVVRLYGLRMWVEQSYKQVKHSLGWSQYQVRSDRAMRRHWQLVCCAFSFCWYHQGQTAAVQAVAASVKDGQAANGARPAAADPSWETAGGKKRRGEPRATPDLLADGAASSARLALSLDHAAALLASVVGAAPTASSSTLA